MIIAAYPGEPLALFMTAEDILDNIAVTFPGVFNVDVTPDPSLKCEDEDPNSGQNPEPPSSGPNSRPKNEIEPETNPLKQENPTATITTDTQPMDRGGALDTGPKPDQRISGQNTTGVIQQLGSTSRSGPRGSTSRYSHLKPTSKRYEYQWVWTCVSNNWQSSMKVD